MYCQGRVSDDQLTFIKFLCCKNRNIEKEPSDFAIYTHIFSGVLSVTCSNYALKRTATANTHQYGQEAAKVGRRNFEVDDLLNSIDDPKPRMIIVKNVLGMCESSRFHLINLIYNNRELLMSFPEDQRRNGVKNGDFISNLPTEKALGIHWKISGDSFAFNIPVNRRTLIKR